MIDPVVLNEEIQPPAKYENFSSEASKNINTLDEPVIDTIKRDVMFIYEKIYVTMSGNGDFEKIKKEWDLWGPLIITLITASMAAFGTKDIEEVFTSTFILMWVGPLLIALNANLLGGNAPIMQTLCLIVYCSAPIMLLAIIIFLLNIVFHYFLINMILGIGTIFYIIRCNQKFFNSIINQERKMLSLYPAGLFYTFMCLFIAMT